MVSDNWKSAETLGFGVHPKADIHTRNNGGEIGLTHRL